MVDFGDDDNKTIFTSDLDDDEKAAVKSGENRGKRVAMVERREHYSLCGERARTSKKFEKNWMYGTGECVGCANFNPDFKLVGEHCTLPKNHRCIR